MAQDLTGLYNLALSIVGTRSRISLPSEKSREAEACTLWYDQARDQVQRAAPWASCRQNALLSVIKERTSNTDWTLGDPEGNWRFVYGLPSDYLQPINLQSFQNFIISNYGGAPALTTNVERAVLTYIGRNTVVGSWENDLFLAIAHALAAAIALDLHGKLTRKIDSVNSANAMILQARIREANSQSVTYDHIPDWLQVRGVGGTTPNKFIYENGPLLSTASLGGGTT